MPNQSKNHVCSTNLSQSFFLFLSLYRSLSLFCPTLLVFFSLYVLLGFLLYCSPIHETTLHIVLVVSSTFSLACGCASFGDSKSLCKITVLHFALTFNIIIATQAHTSHSKHLLNRSSLIMSLTFVLRVMVVYMCVYLRENVPHIE